MPYTPFQKRSYNRRRPIQFYTYRKARGGLGSAAKGLVGLSIPRLRKGKWVEPKPFKEGASDKMRLAGMRAMDRIAGKWKHKLSLRKGIRARKNMMRAFHDQRSSGPLKDEYWNRELMKYFPVPSDKKFLYRDYDPKIDL